MTDSELLIAAIESGNAERVHSLAQSIAWNEQPPAAADRLLQQIALYGCSGRTQRYADAVQHLLDQGVAPSLATCALLMENARAEALLAANPDAPFDVDEDAATPLHHAAERGNTALAKVLCERGADVDAVDAFGQTPIAHALHAGPWKEAAATDIVDMLRAHGATVDFWTLAALGDARALAEALDAAPALLDAPDVKGRTALFHAARNNRLAAVRTLLARGADANRACADGQTALSTACLHMLSQECDQAIVEALLSHGAEQTLEAAIVLEDEAALRRFVRGNPAVLEGQTHESPQPGSARGHPSHEESALGYAIHVWRPKSLRVLIECGAVLSEENWGHVERIAGADSDIVRELRQLAT